MKRKLFLMFILVLLACPLFNVKPTIAASDKCLTDAVHGFDIAPVIIASEMPTIETACNACHETFGGALWINNYAGNTPDSVDMYSSTSEIIVDGDASTTATLYLHGQIYACGVNIYANDSAKYDAHYIYITNNSHIGASESTLQNDVVGYVDNQSTLGSAEASVDRVLEDVTSGMSNRWTKPKRAQPIVINLEKYKKVADLGPSFIRTIGGKKYSFEQWSHTVNVYRCPVSTTNISSDGCWSDESQINLTIRTEIPPSTCSEKYGNDVDYEHTSTVPTWIKGTGNIYYNKCSGTSVLGSRILTKDTSASNYTERAALKNTDSTRSATIYVKPGTNVKFEQFYLPAAQPVTKTIVTENLTAKRSNGEVISIPSTASNVVELSGSGTISGTWTNYKDIGVVDEDATSLGGAVFTFTQGGYDNTPSFNGSNNTGTAHTGSIITETNSGSRSILAGAVVDELKDEGVSNVKESLETTSLTVVAPYNFENEAIANPTNLHAGVFAGSEASISGTYKTKGKYNGAVRATYATISPKSKLRLYSFISDTDNPTQNCNPGGTTPSICKEHTGSEDNVALNPNEITANNVETSRRYTVTVPDADAGKYLCVVAAVYPTSSGADTNYTNTAGNATWGTSTNCTAIQKRAFFQVWGGNLYAKGKVASSTTTKTVIGSTDYTQPITFGSWAEHGIISSKKEVTGVASGAALGYTSNVNGTLINEPGGKANSSKDCRFATFTIANTNCYTGTGINDSATPGNSNIDLSNNMLDLTNYTNTAKTTTARSSSDSSPLDLASEYTVKDGIRYTYAVGSLYLKSSASLPKGVTQVVYATGSVYISSNLNYQNTTYSNPSDVPQLIIVSGSNIYIESAVANVDAWLYTKTGTINTCPDGSTSPACNKQLRINGPIVAGKMILNRNYGGGTGNNSGTPAEIINFTPATYIFSQAKSTENTSLRVVYSKEVAPRY